MKKLLLIALLVVSYAGNAQSKMEINAKKNSDKMTNVMSLSSNESTQAYEMVLKAAHTFNLLDARGAISVTERAAYIGRIRNLSRAVAQAYFDSREKLGFPMCQRQTKA